MQKKIPVDELELGMFVMDLDRPWLDTPFPFQGFAIESPGQIAEVKRYCRFVYVDPFGASHPVPDLDEAALGSSIRALNPTPLSLPLDTDHIKAPDWRLMEYVDAVEMEEELPRAKELYALAEQIISQLFVDLRELRSPDAGRIHDLMGSMAQSMIRNPDALTLLARIRRRSEYAFAHALNVSINTLALGRHLGYPLPDLQQLGIGGLLLDVGTIRVPGALLARNGKLTDEEYATVRRHVEYGVEMLQDTWKLTDLARVMVSHHHEREDGSGYPQGLQGPDIPPAAKIAAIADCFDALTSARPYARTHSPYEALQMLYDWGKHILNGALVEEFIQCLGIYPVGGLVELNSGEVGMVVAHNRVRRLKPRILVLLDRDKQPYKAPMMLDLLVAPKLPGDVPYAVSRALEDGMYGINPQDYYL